MRDYLPKHPPFTEGPGSAPELRVFTCMYVPNIYTGNKCSNVSIYEDDEIWFEMV